MAKLRKKQSIFLKIPQGSSLDIQNIIYLLVGIGVTEVISHQISQEISSSILTMLLHTVTAYHCISMLVMMSPFRYRLVRGFTGVRMNTFDQPLLTIPKMDLCILQLQGAKFVVSTWVGP